jgi:hypothetical protein
VSTYKEGTLVIDIVDISDKEPVWCGLAPGILHEGQTDPQKIQEKVNMIVNKILTGFSSPPGNKSIYFITHNVCPKMNNACVKNKKVVFRKKRH